MHMWTSQNSWSGVAACRISEESSVLYFGTSIGRPMTPRHDRSFQSLEACACRRHLGRVLLLHGEGLCRRGSSSDTPAVGHLRSGVAAGVRPPGLLTLGVVDLYFLLSVCVLSCKSNKIPIVRGRAVGQESCLCFKVKGVPTLQSFWSALRMSILWEACG